MPYRVMEDICLVKCDSWEHFSGDLRSDNLLISAEGWS